jgi:fumarate hydratase class I
MEKKLFFPLSDENVRSLAVGDSVLLSGTIITGRDAAHKWLNDTFVHKTKAVSDTDQAVYNAIKPILDGSALYHCGPVVSGLDTKQYRFVAAGPTTSIREEPYQGDVIRHFNLKGVIGKGGMGAKTLKTCQEAPAVYFHAIGGAAALIAATVERVLAVHKLEFGVPEAMWVIEIRDMPAVVTMDAHGHSLHEDVAHRSKLNLEKLLQGH